MNSLKIAELDNSYARLPERFYARQLPTTVAAPELFAFNTSLANELGLDSTQLTSSDGVGVLAGNIIPQGAEPLAMAYAGHQFGSWVPQLGDGRAILLGELKLSDTRFDLQLKGAGPTPFSRRGDGRAWLGPVLREYIVSESMAALNVPTTRSLAAVATGETVLRESALPGAILTRVAKSHVRVGTFEYFVGRDDVDGLRTLADYVIQRHYPDKQGTENPYVGLLEGVLERQSSLVAQWMGVGFIHGVMNTDNMTISGETIDYGPCAFMDAYDPSKVFSSIDHAGRYAYQNQPRIAQWNLAVLAQCLLPLIDDDQEAAVEVAQAIVDSYADIYSSNYLNTMRAKLGLTESEPGDELLITQLLQLMANNSADFTHTFRALTTLVKAQNVGRKSDDEQDLPTYTIESLIGNDEDSNQWIEDWTRRRAQEVDASTNSSIGIDQQYELMAQHNPIYIPRNHHIENVIQAAVAGQFEPFHQMLAVVTNPFIVHPGQGTYAASPAQEEIVLRTFCGT